MVSDKYGQTDLLAALVRGGGLVVIVLWTCMSFAPLYQIIYGDRTAVELSLDFLFLATGVLGVAALYAALLVMASDRARRTLYPSRGKVLDRLGVFAAVWIVAYGFFG